LSVRKIGVNIKKGLIRCLKTYKLKYLITATIVMIFVVSADVTNAVSKAVQSKPIKDGLANYTEYANIVKGIIPNL